MPIVDVIIVAEDSARLRYTLDFIFRARMGITYQLQNPSEQSLSNPNVPVIHYNHEPAAGNEYLRMSPLPIMADSFRDFSWRPPGGYDRPPEDLSEENIDVFGLIFFMLSRFEEYDRLEHDSHGRFPAQRSWAFQHDILDFPLVDAWILKLAKLLGVNYQPEFEVRPTYDIDVAYAYHGRPWWRMAGAAVREVIKGRAGDLGRRLSFSLGSSEDPYDTYAFQTALHRELDLLPRYFLLVGKRGPNDHNLSSRSRAMHKLIKRLMNEGGQIGLHPSYDSFNDRDKLAAEKSELENIVQSSVEHSRQHYLRLNTPATYRYLLDVGIRHEYTMGYAAVPGYRAGTGRSYMWFDLDTNEPTALTIHPFVVMDGTLSDYMNLSPARGQESLEQLLHIAFKYKTVFCTLWHNHTLALRGTYRGWRKIYENILRKAVDLRDAR